VNLSNQIPPAIVVLKAISHPLRLEVMRLLCAHKSLSVGELQASLQVEQAVVSQHLKVMKVNGVVLCEKSGTQVHYRLKSSKYKQLLKSLMNCNE
jgi:DNA-binding transcriptional ArsR family regulator